MIDINVLRGATVRDNAGTRGEILGVSMPWVRVGWWDEGAVRPREESFLRSDPRVSSIFVLTLSEGWVPATQIFGTGNFASPEDTDDLSEDLATLIQEAPGGKLRSPFKRANSIGPGPRHGWGKKRGGSKHKKKNYWDCNASGKYTYKCKGKEGENKTVKVDSTYKADYNKLYKAWHRARLKTAAPNTFIKKGKPMAKSKK